MDDSRQNIVPTNIRSSVFTEDPDESWHRMRKWIEGQTNDETIIEKCRALITRTGTSEQK